MRIYEIVICFLLYIKYLWYAVFIENTVEMRMRTIGNGAQPKIKLQNTKLKPHLLLKTILNKYKIQTFLRLKSIFVCINFIIQLVYRYVILDFMKDIVEFCYGMVIFIRDGYVWTSAYRH